MIKTISRTDPWGSGEWAEARILCSPPTVDELARVDAMQRELDAHVCEKDAVCNCILSGWRDTCLSIIAARDAPRERACVALEYSSRDAALILTGWGEVTA